MTKDTLRQQYPDSPWMWREEWAAGKSSCSGKSGLYFSWIFTIFWNGFIWPVLIIAGPDLWHRYEEEGEYVLAIVPVFGVVGLGLLCWAIYRAMVWIKFRTSVFHLASVPGVIGGRLEGMVHSPLKQPPEEPIHLALSCLRIITTRDRHGDRRSRTHTIVLWSKKESIKPEKLAVGRKGLMIPVSLSIPYSLEPSDDSNPNNMIKWQLAVFCELPGVDYSPIFEVPLFITSESRWETEEERRAHLQEIASAPASKVLSQEDSWVVPMSILPTPRGGIEFRFRPQITMGQAIGVTIFTLAVLAFIPVQIKLGWPGIIPGLTALFGALFLLATVAIWTFASRVVIEDQVLVLYKSLAGIERVRHIPCPSIQRLEVKEVGQVSADRPSKSPSWEIEIFLDNGERVDPGAMFSDRKHTEWVAAEMERHILG